MLLNSTYLLTFLLTYSRCSVCVCVCVCVTQSLPGGQPGGIERQRRRTRRGRQHGSRPTQLGEHSIAAAPRQGTPAADAAGRQTRTYDVPKMTAPATLISGESEGESGGRGLTGP